jgi:hypothetical protein
MLTWIIYQAQHSDTDLVLERTKKPFQCNSALLADLGDSIFLIFQFSCNYAYHIYCQSQIHIKTLFTAKHTLKHASRVFSKN